MKLIQVYAGMGDQGVAARYYSRGGHCDAMVPLQVTLPNADRLSKFSLYQWRRGRGVRGSADPQR